MFTPQLRKLLGLMALVGLLLSLSVHLLAILGNTVVLKIPGVMFLHLGMFAVFVPMIFAAGAHQKQIKESRLGLLAIFPLWTRGVLFALPLYVAANFMIFTATTEGGTPSEKADGTYVLQNRGTLIRKITKKEYEAFRVNEIRGFSGHWLIFYGVPMLFFFFVPAPKKEEDKRART